MPYKNKEERREHYEKNKDEINKKRREYNKKPEVLERKKECEKKWRDNNKEKVKERNKVYSKKNRDKNRELVFNHYGKQCSCCGEKELKFLSIDHINGKGTKHRKKIKNQTYIWLIKNNYPKGFQTLCFNCNWGRYRNNGICPHKNK